MFTFQRRYRHARKIILIIESSINESTRLLQLSTVGEASNIVSEVSGVTCCEGDARCLYHFELMNLICLIFWVTEIITDLTKLFV